MPHQCKRQQWGNYPWGSAAPTLNVLLWVPCFRLRKHVLGLLAQELRDTEQGVTLDFRLSSMRRPETEPQAYRTPASTMSFNSLRWRRTRIDSCSPGSVSFTVPPESRLAKQTSPLHSDTPSLQSASSPPACPCKKRATTRLALTGSTSLFRRRSEIWRLFSGHKAARPPHQFHQTRGPASQRLRQNPHSEREKPQDDRPNHPAIVRFQTHGFPFRARV